MKIESDVKFTKSHDFGTARVGYLVMIRATADVTAFVHRDGGGWKAADYLTGEEYTAGTRRDAVAAMLAARETEADRTCMIAEVDRAWERIGGGGAVRGGFTTAWHAMTSAEENADDTAGEQGFARHSHQWYSCLVSTYNNLDEYYGYGDLVYTRNIEADIADGVMEEI